MQLPWHIARIRFWSVFSSLANPDTRNAATYVVLEPYANAAEFERHGRVFLFDIETRFDGKPFLLLRYADRFLISAGGFIYLLWAAMTDRSG